MDSDADSGTGVPVIPKVSEEDFASAVARLNEHLSSSAEGGLSESTLSIVLSGCAHDPARGAALWRALGAELAAPRLIRLSAKPGLSECVQALCAELADTLLVGDSVDPMMFNGDVTSEAADCTRIIVIGAESRRLDIMLRIPETYNTVRHGRSTIPCMLWPSAEILARALFTERIIGPVTGLRVVELGAGCHGLPSQAAAVAGAAEVVATEIDPRAIQLLRQQVQYCNARVARLDWDDCSMLDGDLGLFDLAIGSDLVYETSIGSKLLRAIDSLLHPSGEALLVSPSARYRFGVKEFQTLLMENAWQADVEEASDALLEGVDTQGLSYELWRIRRCQSRFVDPKCFY